jgi:hypothetical protein
MLDNCEKDGCTKLGRPLRLGHDQHTTLCNEHSNEWAEACLTGAVPFEAYAQTQELVSHAIHQGTASDVKAATNAALAARLDFMMAARAWLAGALR